MLVGWSYGGFIICDYLRAHGQDTIGAIDLVGAATTLGPAAFGTLIGPGFLDHVPDTIADDLPTNIRGIRGLVQTFPATPYPPDEVEMLLCSAMTAPAQIRAILATCPTAQPSWYDGVGHTCFPEDPDRCNHELATRTRHTHT